MLGLSPATFGFLGRASVGRARDHGDVVGSYRVGLAGVLEFVAGNGGGDARHVIWDAGRIVAS